MYIGFINLHPVTLPIGNELVHALNLAINHAYTVYVASIEPDLLKLASIIDLL